MRFILPALLALLFLSPLVQADDKDKAKGKDDKPKTAKEQYESLIEEAEDAQGKAVKAMREAKTDADRVKIRNEFMTKTLPPFAPRFLELAEKYPQDKEIALKALLAVPGIVRSGPQLNKALDMILKDHEDSLAQVVPMLIGSRSPAAEKFLKLAQGQAKTRSGKAIATLGLAQLAKQRLEDVDPKSADAAKFSKEAETHFEEVASKYKDVGPASAIADKELFELKNLMIGKVIPDIEGEDSDGKKFKLSDYRGKVVVLDFWAEWCSPCMALVPHERTLVKRLQDKPFALIGVNLDDSKDTLKKCEEKNEMTWRSFHDAKGKISDKWNITSIPVIYVLDSKGVIRYKGVRDKDMDEAVDTLLAEMKK